MDNTMDSADGFKLARRSLAFSDRGSIGKSIPYLRITPGGQMTIGRLHVEYLFENNPEAFDENNTRIWIFVQYDPKKFLIKLTPAKPGVLDAYCFREDHSKKFPAAAKGSLPGPLRKAHFPRGEYLLQEDSKDVFYPRSFAISEEKNEQEITQKDETIQPRDEVTWLANKGRKTRKDVEPFIARGKVISISNKEPRYAKVMPTNSKYLQIFSGSVINMRLSALKKVNHKEITDD